MVVYGMTTDDRERLHAEIYERLWAALELTSDGAAAFERVLAQTERALVLLVVGSTEPLPAPGGLYADPVFMEAREGWVRGL